MHQELQAKLAMTLPALFQHGDAAKLSFIVWMITLDRSEGELLLVMVMSIPVHGCLSHADGKKELQAGLAAVELAEKR